MTLKDSILNFSTVNDVVYQDVRCTIYAHITYDMYMIIDFFAFENSPSLDDITIRNSFLFHTVKDIIKSYDT